MLKRHAAIVFGFGIAVGACSDSPTRGIAPPELLPSLSAGTSTDVDLLAYGTLDDASALEAVAAEQAATGGRASGHADIASGPMSQRYSFSALSTGDFPNAKGQAEVHIVGLLGRANVHVDVDCLAITGDNAWVSGPVTKFRFNGEDVAIVPGLQVLFRVQDGGEGRTAVDGASLAVASVGAQVCRARPAHVLLPSDDGNIQVSQR